MTLPCARRVRAHPLAVMLLAAAFATVLVEGGTIPHVHIGSEPGFYNHDHDLSLLAMRAFAGPLPDVTPAFFVFRVVPAPSPLTATEPDSAPGRHADVRAPPAR